MKKNKNKETDSGISAEILGNIILLGAILLAYVVYTLVFRNQPKEKPHVSEQSAEQSVSGCNGDCGCCKCKDDPRGETYEEPLWEY